MTTGRTSDPDRGWTEAASGRTFDGVLAPALAGIGLLVRIISFHWLWGRWKNKVEARSELRRIVAEHADLDYDAWRAVLGRRKRLEFTTEAGTWYQATVEPVWDDQPRGAIRVLFSLDDGGSSAFFPMTDSLLMDPPSTMPEDAVQQ